MVGKARPTVLVVDDQDFFQVWIRDALDGLYEVVATPDSSGALKILRRQPVAAILLDVMLGPEDGLDLIRPIRTLSRAPIVVVTGHSDEGSAIRAANLRVDGYLKKPFSRLELHTKLVDIVPVDPIDHAKAFIELHFAEDLNAADVAQSVGISEGYLRGQFLKVYGYTPIQYMRYTRLHEASKLLLTTERPIAEVARSVGFTNPERFRRTFTRLLGMSPSAYRSRKAVGAVATSENDGPIDENAD